MSAIIGAAALLFSLLVASAMAPSQCAPREPILWALYVVAASVWVMATVWSALEALIARRRR